MAPTLAELVVADPPEAWRDAGFAVDDGMVRVGGIAIRLVGRATGKRIQSWSFRGLTPEALVDGTIDGLPTSASDQPPSEAAHHPNGCRQIDHVVVLSPDLERTLAAFDDIGLAVRASKVTENYGLPMRQAFLRAGEAIIEVIGPIDPPDAPESEGPAGWFGLAYTVDDLPATAELLGERLGTIKDAVQEDRQIATLRHRDVGMSVATAFMSPAPE